MNPTTLSKFTECSKLYEEEAKKSDRCWNKIYVSERRLISGLEMGLHLGQSGKDSYAFCFEFFDAEENQTIVVYKCNTAPGVVSKWTTTESENRRDVRMKYFNEYVEKCENGIKSLHFMDDEASLRDYKIERLEELEELVIMGTQEGYKELIENGTLDFDQLMSLKCFKMENAYLTFDEIIQFQGKTMICSSENLNQSKVEAYLKMIKRREILKDLKFIRIFLNCSIDFKDLKGELRGSDYRKNMWAREEDAETFTFKARRENIDFDVTYDGFMIQIQTE